MRRITIILLLLTTILAMPLSAAAEEGAYADIFTLYNDVWSYEGQPDWVCSVSSTDGSMENLTVIVHSAEQEAELRSMLQDDSTLTVIISETAYTERELMLVQQEIVRKYMKGSDPIVCGAGIGWTSMDGELTGFGESGKESRVIVSVLPEYVEEYAALFREEYGDMVYVEGGGRPVEETAAEAPAAADPWPVFAGTALAAAAACVIIAVRRTRRKRVANNG